MTPAQLREVFTYIERSDRRVAEVEVNEDDFEPVASYADFTPTVGGGPILGTIWGARVFLVDIPEGQVRVNGHRVGEDQRHEALVSYLFDIEPTVRLHVDEYDIMSVAREGLKVERQLKEIRDHVVSTEHREFSAQFGLLEGPRDSWVVTCCVDPFVACTSWYFTTTEIASAGRADLTDIAGWVEELNAAKALPSLVRPVAWTRLGQLFEDD